MDNTFPVIEYNLIKIAGNFQGFASPGGDPRSNTTIPCWYILNGAGLYNSFNLEMTRNFGIATFDGEEWKLYETDLLLSILEQLSGLLDFQIAGYAVPSTNPLPSIGFKIWFASQDGSYNNFPDETGRVCTINGELAMFMGDNGIFRKESLLNLNEIRSPKEIRLNGHEPYSSHDPSDPEGANYFKGNDYIYEKCDGIWKRYSLNIF